MTSLEDQYVVVKHDSLDAFTTKVNELLKQGYVPQGGISTFGIKIGGDTSLQHILVYHQALIKGKK